MMRAILSSVALVIPTIAWAQGFSPEVALQRMKVADGLQVSLVATEPLVRQPVTMTFDDRGRLWVIQYLQYPTPAGLKPVAVDQYLRTKYDRTPEPPPRGPKGLDRVTILFDPDGTGRFRKAKDFVSGLNLASGLALGHGGAFVLQAPYLLFYPDKDHNDVPDHDPDVLLSGFGMEDAHAVGNSLVWGPDGWLYGAQGSTVTARIQDPVSGAISEFQQGIWRYHPKTHQFELFAEGGGNTWGLDFDRQGQIIAGTNWGGFACLHMVQGGYYVKGFAKHGPLHHPYAFGYFDHIPCEGFRGGHVTCGGIVYQGDALPERFRDSYLGCNLLDNNIYWYSLQRKGSTFTSKHEGTLLQSNDTWFRPIDLLTGPDGAVYVCDWYDKRANHVDPVDNWDRTNGRVYRIGAADKPLRPTVTAVPLSKKSGEELIALLRHPNSWQRGEARRILAERRDAALNSTLEELVERAEPSLALEALWALYASGGWSEEMALRCLQHASPAIRAWAVRFVGEEGSASAAVVERLRRLGSEETDAQVRSQLLSSLRRLTPDVRLKLMPTLCRHDVDATDAHLPLQLWWLVESLVPDQLDDVISLFQGEELWKHPLVIKTLAGRMAQRLLACEAARAVRVLDLLHSAPIGAGRSQVLDGIEQAWPQKPGKRLASAMKDYFKASPANLQELRVQLVVGVSTERSRAWKIVLDEKTPGAERIKLLTALAVQLPWYEVSDVMALFRVGAQPEALRIAALGVLEGQSDPAVGPFLVELLPKTQGDLRRRLVASLTQKPATGRQLIRLVAEGKVAAKELSLDQVQRVAGWVGDDQKAVIAKYWGNVRPATSGEKRARINSILHLLGQGKGDMVHGAALFKEKCAACHTLFGAGGKVGPDLTTADRGNREFLATHIVDPHRVIRPEYVAFVCVTKDGRTLTGLVAEETAGSMTLLDDKGRTTIRREEIEELKASDKSLMAEGLLDTLDDQGIRDLFAYLQAPEEPPGSSRGSRQEVTKEPVQASGGHRRTPQSPERPRRDEPGGSSQVPGTSPLTEKLDFADKMVAGIDRFLMGEIERSVEKRQRYWKRETSSPEAYLKSVEGNRQRLRERIGAVDERVKNPVLEYVTTTTQPSRVGKGQGFEVFAVRWRAFGEVEGEGLLLVPEGKPVADVVAIPDADQTPEQLVGLTPGVEPDGQFVRRLAEAGCRVIVPVILDRRDTYSGNPSIRMTNQPHREWVYRQAFEMGRHVIGYEVQKVLAAVDWFAADQTQARTRRKLALIGQGEGGLLAMFAGALDTRLDVVQLCGYFGKRERLGEMPIYRNIWRLLTEFGDAEVATLFAQRVLLLEEYGGPVVSGPPSVRSGRAGAAPGRLEVGMSAGVEAELSRARHALPENWTTQWSSLSFPSRGFLRDGTEVGFPNVRPHLDTFLKQFPAKHAVSYSMTKRKPELAHSVDSEARFKRQLDQLVNHTQSLLRHSQDVREKNFWSKLDRSSLEKYRASTKPLRKQFEEEVIGKIDEPLSPPKPRSRLLYEEPTYIAYEVELDVFAPDVIAYGWLLVPKDIKPGERRAVIVCQHGLEGRPADVADPKKDHPAYHRFACRLAEKGYVVFAPQNPYIFGDRFRMLQRKANPLGLSLFSFIVAQHRQITDWLAGLPFVDPERIAFYGLSYGGKTAMRVPALVPRYCLSICSADFNEWVWKNVSVDSKYSYLFTNEWEMPEWNLGHTYNYAEMAALIAPRPFMVERGHHDGVAPDEQVAYEYAKVRRLYAELKIPERTEIEFFDGPHTINGVGTFRFLDKHLKR